MIDWFKLVQERNAWVARNFPTEDEIPGRESILGCIEEHGELAHAHLKCKQGIRGTREEHEAAMQDAIGDLMVYLLGVMAAVGYVPQKPTKHSFLKATSDEDCILNMRTGIAYLPVTWAIEQLVHYSRKYCKFKGWDFDNLVNATWDHVKQRDWVAHREAGAPREDELMRDPPRGDDLDLLYEKLYDSTDPMVWATEFCKTFRGQKVGLDLEDGGPLVGEELMVSWFSNVMTMQERRG